MEQSGLRCAQRFRLSHTCPNVDGMRRQFLAQPCHSDDQRYEKWSALVLRLASTEENVAIAARDDLRRLGFAAEVHVPAARSGEGRGAPKRRRWWRLWTFLALLPFVFAATRIASRVCGKPLPGGGYCQRPLGCRIPHKAPQLRAPDMPNSDHDVTLALPDLALMRTVSDLNREGGDPSTVAAAARKLNDHGYGIAPPQGKLFAGADRILRHFEKTKADGGFTSSPTDIALSATSGVCVAFNNTPFSWQEGEPEGESDFVDWLSKHKSVLLEEGTWIGGWVNPESGECEVNVTYVFKPVYAEEAKEFSRLQNQAACYWIDAPEGTENTIPTGGDGGTRWTPTGQQGGLIHA